MVQNSKAPLVIIAFTRDVLLRRVLERLMEASGVGGRSIFVYIDGPRKDADLDGIDRVCRVVKEMQEKYRVGINVVQREVNYGCQKNISSAISEVINKFGRVIVVEDDVLVSRTFFSYLDAALEYYEKDHRIWSINAYQSPYMKVPRGVDGDLYLSPRNLCLGWGTWADRWNKVDFEIKDWPSFKDDPDRMRSLNEAGIDLAGMMDKHYAGQLNSWAVPCTYYMVKNNLFSVEPRFSLTKNIGFGAQDSVHTGCRNLIYEKQCYYNFNPRLKTIAPDERVLKRIKYNSSPRGLIDRVYRKCKRELLRFGGNKDNPIDIV